MFDIESIIEHIEQSGPDRLKTIDELIERASRATKSLTTLRQIIGGEKERNQTISVQPGKFNPGPQSRAKPGGLTDKRTQRRIMLARHIENHGPITGRESCKITKVSEPTGYTDLVHEWFLKTESGIFDLTEAGEAMLRTLTD